MLMIPSSRTQAAWFALATALTAAQAGHAATVQAQAAAVGGQASCGTFGPPPSIGSLFGSIFSVGNVGNGISDCGLQGSIADSTLPTGAATVGNSVTASVGGGPYTGTSGASASYGSLNSSAHGLMDGVTNLLGFSESGGFARFNDQLVFSSAGVANGSAGSVVYTFTVVANLTTPRGTALTYASQNLAELAVAQNAVVQGYVFGASTYPFSLGSVLGASDPALQPGFAYGMGSVVGSHDFSTVPLPFTWGASTDLTVGLAAVSFVATGGELDAQMQAVLSHIEVFGANGAPIGDVKIDAASGVAYTVAGVSTVPEPTPAAMLLAGLALCAGTAHGLRPGRHPG